MFQHYIAIRQGAFPVPNERFSIEEQSIEYCGACTTLLDTTAHPQYSIDCSVEDQKALGTLPEDGNAMPKHVGATVHHKLEE
jgi:hypothetical protein